MNDNTTPSNNSKMGELDLQSFMLGDAAPKPREDPEPTSVGGDQLTMTPDGHLTTHITIPDTLKLLPRCLDFSEPVPGPQRPGAVARLIAHMLADDEGVHLRHWRDGWYIWRDGRTGGRYRPFGQVDNKYAVPDMVRALMDNATYQYETQKRGVEVKNWDPNNRSVKEVTDALAAASRPDETMSAGTWIGNDAAARELETPGNEVTCVANGLLWCPPSKGAESRKLMPHTPAFFTDAAVAVDYDPEAECPLWMKFLGELWPDDHASQQLLQEWFGYVLTRSTSLQKILVLVGPRRCGKGTAAWVLEELLGGRSEVDHPLMSTFGDKYGLSNMLGKRLAIFGDARMEKSEASIVEKLLMISGEDPVTVERKYLSPVITKLDVRLMIMSNAMPDLRDTTGALAGRFLPLPIKIEGFYGKEDRTLKHKLGRELTGILNWALEGADRLWGNDGKFTVGENVKSAMGEADRSGSPLKAFTMDRLVFEAGAAATKDSVYWAYEAWCEAEGFHKKGKNVFFRDLMSIYPDRLGAGRHTIAGRQQTVLLGAYLSPEN